MPPPTTSSPLFHDAFQETPESRKTFRTAIFLSILLFLLGTWGLWWNLFKVPSSASPEMVITIEKTDVYVRPSAHGPSLTSLPAGSRLEVLQEKDNWLRIKSDDSTGWISKQLIVY